ncbi:glycoside hydrolase family 3 N-terminal domain-containing protein [Brevibacterium yomogidense]|uniref:glycoside hydrolase family 3 N-terminal domain-containing protein n=1 Tax=Brevibacterium yomogidense TaxID=946573 RepID=UPI0018DF5609|nr:glycoside hydrolase family 3 N-terminal domain-containing protein [Brevibacterium yomogidense]
MRTPFGVIPVGAASAALALVLAGCGSGSPDDVGGESAVATGASATGTAAAGDPGDHATADTDAPPADGVTDADVEAAEQIVAAMDDDELVGSVVMLTYNGTDVAAAADVIRERHLAGAIVMGYNLADGADADTVWQTTDTLAGAAGERGWPVAIGVDQEGGPVARLDDAALDFPPLMAAGAADDADVTRDAIAAQGTDLRNLGFTINFSPVADLTIGAEDPVINVRSPGDDPERVSEVIDAVVGGFTSTGLASAAKHFPGHGALTVDSHEELPVSEDSLEDLADTSYEPFRTAAEAGVPMVLVGHIGLPGTEDVPATLNPDVYESLRDDVGFDGVAVTDALNMGAVTEAPGQETVKAIAAGADLALMPPDSGDAVAALGEALEAGDLPRERLVEAATRVVAMQLWQARIGAVGGVDGEGAEGEGADDGVGAQGSRDGVGAEGSDDGAGAEDAQGSRDGAGGDAAAEGGGDGAGGDAAADDALTALADGSLTVLAGECSFAEPADAVAVTGGSDSARAAFTDAAEDAGLEVRDAGGGNAVTVRVGSGQGGGSADVVVGTSGPWAVEDAGADTILEVYDDNPHALTAVAKYLAGDLEATGRTPVDVSVDAPDCAAG